MTHEMDLVEACLRAYRKTPILYFLTMAENILHDLIGRFGDIEQDDSSYTIEDLNIRLQYVEMLLAERRHHGTV